MVTVGLSPWAKSVVLHRIIGAMASFGSTYKAQERAHILEEMKMKNTILTEERLNSITNALDADIKRAESLLALGVDEAVESFRDLGYDFTREELIAYGDVVKNSTELSDDDLTSVAGGIGESMEEDSWGAIKVVATVGFQVGKGIGNIINNITGR